MPEVPPAVFNTPTLGQAVVLGELYDHRTGKFLGVQLYPQSKVQEVETDIRNTDLTVSLSTTHKDKASLLDIKAKLSLDILGGLIKVSGSASYLNDEKSNTNEYAYALALKMRLKEKRILFAEDDLGHNVLPVAQQDYISTKLATHFVSSITLGGNYIVNLVAKQSKMSKEEKIEGQLQLQFDKLKGAISLDGEASADIRNGFNDMNDKFDLTIHGDVALDKVPINPQDVLDTFPQAASLISDGGGVPIAATLQPIPPALYKGGLLYDLLSDFVDDVVKAFSLLDDLTSRFLVLQDSAQTLQDYVPELARTVRVVADTYTKDHNVLRHELAKFLLEYQQGIKPPSGTVFSSALVSGGGAPGPSQGEEEPVQDSDITGEKVLKQATDLYEKHLDPNAKIDPAVSKQYPPNLVGLEKAFLQFQYFAEDVQKVRKSLPSPTKKSDQTGSGPENTLYLSNIEDICRVIRIHTRIPLFVMIPLTADGSNPDLAIVRYLALLRKYAGFFSDPDNPPYMLYAENLDDLERRLPNDKKFSGLKVASVFVGTVDSEGTLTWNSSPKVPDPPTPTPGADLTFPLNHKPDPDSIGHIAFSLDPVDGTKSFSIQIRARQSQVPSSTPVAALRLEYAINESQFLVFQVDPLSIVIGNRSEIGVSEKKSPKTGTLFLGTFVQDVAAKQWSLYLNGERIATKTFTDNDIISDAKKLQIGFGQSEKWWTGEVVEVKGFTRAVTAAEVKSQYDKWLNN